MAGIKNETEKLVLTTSDNVDLGRDVNNINDLYSYSYGLEQEVGLQVQQFIDLDLVEDPFVSNSIEDRSEISPLSKGGREQSVRLFQQENLTQNNNTENCELTLQESSKNVKNNIISVDGKGEHKTRMNGNSGTCTPTNVEGQDSPMKVKKGISFPKDTCISGYFEPPDPWKNAPTWTTQELISAYRKSCEIHGAKPIIKVIQQLQTISVPGKREELLSFKGEKLDLKQCESIEEILRRVQFKLLDFEASHLDDECAVALFDMIEYYESACQLNISFNKNIGPRAWQACSRLVRRTPTLTYMDMRNCEFKDRTIPIFGRALKLGCHLTILHMEALNLTGKSLLVLVAALKMNTTLQELFLADNKLVPTDGYQLGNLMHYNHRLSLLDLRNNHLQDVGTGHICDGLLEQHQGLGLRTLVLWDNQITYQAMPALGKALAVSESLETLNIGHNPITNEGIHLLKDGLLKTNSLLRLGLQGTKISDEGAVALAEYIADSVILLRMDLRDNEIKTGGLMALSHAMRVNTSVTRMDLDKDAKKESSMKDYAEQQSRLQRDILTFQQRNVQVAIDREEEERTKLEEKAKAAEAARQERKQEAEVDKLKTPQVEDGGGSESFTVINKEEVPDKDVDQEEEVDGVKESADKNKQGEGIEHTADLSLVPSDSASPADVSKHQDEQQHPSPARPDNLFQQHKLHPQESLDSPVPSSSEANPLIAEASAEPCDVSQTSQSVPIETPVKNRLALKVGSPTADMILSPQYYPKQLARKIFSVSRVEEGDTPPLSCSPSQYDSMIHPLSAAYSQLKMSTSPAVYPSSSSFDSTAPSSNPAATSQLAPRSGAAEAVSPSVSPTTLFRRLADEAEKQMIYSNDEPLDHTTHTPGNKCLQNINSTDEDTVCRDGTSGTAVADTAAGALSPSQSGENIKQFTVEECRESSTLDFLRGDKAMTCDILDASVEVITSDSLLMKQEVGDRGISSSNVENIVKQHSTSALSTSLQSSQLHGGDSHGQNMKMTAAQDDSATCDISAGLSVEDEVNSPTSSQVSLLCTSEGGAVQASKASGDASEMSKTADATLLHSSHEDRDDVLIQGGGGCSDDTLSSAVSGSDVMEGTHFSGLLRDLSSTSPLTPCSISVSGSSDKVSKTGHLASQEDNISVKTSVSQNQASSGVAGNESDSPHSKDFTPVYSSDAFSSLCHPSETASPDNAVRDHIEIEKVDLSLDEEPWLAVDEEDVTEPKQSTDDSGMQPDFFTTLSMNGLTQELASALTSLDGAATGVPDEAYNESDLRPPDEFERELDAMLAVVKSEMPWT